jgi:hypothetical protein
MNRLASMASAIAFALVSLAGCNVAGGIGAAVTDVQSALAVGCPILNAVQASKPTLNANQNAAMATLALACPPNPPPTSAVVAVADLISAYTILQPLIRN